MSHPALSAFRKCLDGCEIALLVDVDTRTCLVSSSIIEPSQDQLEELCELATTCLGPTTDHRGRFCIVSGPVEIRVFARIRSALPEALCLILAPTAPLDGLEARIDAFLQAESLGGGLV